MRGQRRRRRICAPNPGALRARAFESNAAHFADVFANGRDDYAIPAGVQAPRRFRREACFREKLEVPMTGQAHWLVLLPLLASFVVIGLLAWRDAVQKRKLREEVRTFRCPTLLRRVTATLVRDAKSGEVVGVSRCGEFADPEKVACPKACVDLFNRPSRPAA